MRNASALMRNVRVFQRCAIDTFLPTAKATWLKVGIGDREYYTLEYGAQIHEQIPEEIVKRRADWRPLPRTDVAPNRIGCPHTTFLCRRCCSNILALFRPDIRYENQCTAGVAMIIPFERTATQDARREHYNACTFPRSI